MSTDKKSFAKTAYILTYGLLFLGILLLHLGAKPSLLDDAWFQERTQMYSLGEFLRMRYFQWSSRVVIEAVIYELSAASFALWRVLDSMILILAVQSLERLLTFRWNRRWLVPLACSGLLLLVPMESFVGWIATSTNYFWPAALGLYALVPGVLFVRGTGTKDGAFKKWEYVTVPFAMLYASNQEQCGALLFGAYLVIVLFDVICGREERKGADRRLVRILFLMAFVSLVFTATCPGNEVRRLEEIGKWYPKYVEYGLGGKLAMAYISTAAYYVSGIGPQVLLPIVLFGLWMAILILPEAGLREEVVPCSAAEGEPEIIRAGTVKNEPEIIRPGTVTNDYKRSAMHRAGKWVGASALCISVIWGSPIRSLHMENIWGGLMPYYHLLENQYLPGEDLCGNSPFWVCVEGGIFALFLLWIAVALYLVHGKTVHMVSCQILLAAGLCSRLIIGLSPTIYASGFRTAHFMTISLLYLAADAVLRAHEAAVQDEKSSDLHFSAIGAGMASAKNRNGTSEKC